MHLQARHPSDLLALPCWNSLSSVPSALPSTHQLPEFGRTCPRHRELSWQLPALSAQRDDASILRQATPSYAAAIGWLEDGHRPGLMDSADLLRAGRRGTCWVGGGGAWQRCARVRTVGAWSTGAGGVGGGDGGLSQPPGEMASWARLCASA